MIPVTINIPHKRRSRKGTFLPAFFVMTGLLVAFPGRSPGNSATVSGNGSVQSFTFEYPADHAVPGENRTLSLAAAIDRALTANRSLGESFDRVSAARFSRDSAAAEFEILIAPSAELGAFGSSDGDQEDALSAGISLRRKFRTGTEVTIIPSISKTGNQHRTAVEGTLTQPLLRGLGSEVNLAGIHAAQFSLRSARRADYLAKVNTVLATVAAVYEVERQRHLLILNRESAERMGLHAEAARARERIGLATQIDTYRAVIQQKQAENSLATAREAYSDALDNLKILLALPLEEEVEVHAPLTFDLMQYSSDEAITAALLNRVELRQTQDSATDADRRARLAKDDIMPDLDLVLSYTRFDSADSFNDSHGFNRDSWGVSLVSGTDLRRTRERAAYEQSLLNVRSARRSHDVQRDDVTRQVKSAIRLLRRSERRIAILEEEIHHGRGQLKLAEVQFRWGLADNFDVVEAEASIRRAQTDLLTAAIDYIVGTYLFRAAVGTLVETPEDL